MIRATLWAVLAMYKDHPVERNTSPSLHLKRYQDSKQKHRNTLQGEMYVNKYTKQGGHWSTCLGMNIYYIAAYSLLFSLVQVQVKRIKLWCWTKAEH